MGKVGKARTRSRKDFPDICVAAGTVVLLSVITMVSKPDFLFFFLKSVLNIVWYPWYWQYIMLLIPEVLQWQRCTFGRKQPSERERERERERFNFFIPLNCCSTNSHYWTRRLFKTKNIPPGMAAYNSFGGPFSQPISPRNSERPTEKGFYECSGRICSFTHSSSCNQRR